MNARSVLRKGFGPGFLVAAMAAAFACGPKEPPRQAADNGPPDPLSEGSSSSGSAYQSGKSSSGGGGGEDFSTPSGPPVKSKGGEAPQVPTLATFQEGVQWGITHAELQKQFTQTGGVIWKDYDEKLAKARVGPEQTALEAERESVKGAFGRSYIEFGATPTGYDSTGLNKEYTYRNKESLMWLERKGKKRFYFFINDKLWKMYDEVPFQSGLMGGSYQEAVAKINATLNASGRSLQPNPEKGIDKPTTDWKDGRSHLRAVDRTNEGMVGVAIEDLSVLSNLAALRPNKPSDPNELDPSIVAVTRGRPDPNAAPSASASGKKPAPPKKK
ncbi:MAG: hypothetical protein KIT84_21505 [Labilithrix sp.]|nr:hypothetical protein [Labilithrix sp.]MCW5813621.1 hypothetical protein [Labilithrix sp.]